MYIPKRYGQSKIDTCPFCNKHATTTSNQGVPVCKDHKDSSLDNLKCICGEYLDVRTGKFGAYFNCIKCGNMNMKKALEINEKTPNQEYKIQTKEKTSIEPKQEVNDQGEETIKEEKYNQKETEERKETPKKGFKLYSKPKETTIRSDDPNYF